MASQKFDITLDNGSGTQVTQTVYNKEAIDKLYPVMEAVVQWDEANHTVGGYIMTYKDTTSSHYVYIITENQTTGARTAVPISGESGAFSFRFTNYEINYTPPITDQVAYVILTTQNNIDADGGNLDATKLVRMMVALPIAPTGINQKVDLSSTTAGNSINGATLGVENVLPVANGGTGSSTEKYLQLTGGTLSGTVSMGTNKVTGLADPTVDTDAVNLKTLKSYATATGYLYPIIYLHASNDTASHCEVEVITKGDTSGSCFIFILTDSGTEIAVPGIYDGTADQTDYNYADNITISYILFSKANSTSEDDILYYCDVPPYLSGAYLPLAGGTMTGNIDLNNKRIANVPNTPTATTDAINAKYVNDIETILQTQINDLKALGHFLGSCATETDLPDSYTGFAPIIPTINDLYTVESDSTQGGSTTVYRITDIDISNDTITWTYDHTISSGGTSTVTINDNGGTNLLSAPGSRTLDYLEQRTRDNLKWLFSCFDNNGVAKTALKLKIINVPIHNLASTEYFEDIDSHGFVIGDVFSAYFTDSSNEYFTFFEKFTSTMYIGFGLSLFNGHLYTITVTNSSQGTMISMVKSSDLNILSDTSDNVLPSVGSSAADTLVTKLRSNIKYLFNNYLPLSGGTMTGNINMGFHDLTDVANVISKSGEQINIKSDTSVRLYYENGNDIRTVTAGPANINLRTSDGTNACQVIVFPQEALVAFSGTPKTWAQRIDQSILTKGDLPNIGVNMASYTWN